jgi:hypothetical protein
MSYPAFFFISGGSHRPIVYDKVRDGIANAGFGIVAISLPSVGAILAKNDFSDVQAFRDGISF